MKITVVAKPGKKKQLVQQLTPTSYQAAVTAPARDGRANQAILEALAKYFDIPKSQIVMLTGSKSPIKIFSVPDSLADFLGKPEQKRLV